MLQGHTCVYRAKRSTPPTPQPLEYGPCPITTEFQCTEFYEPGDNPKPVRKGTCQLHMQTPAAFYTAVPLSRGSPELNTLFACNHPSWKGYMAYRGSDHSIVEADKSAFQSRH